MTANTSRRNFLKGAAASTAVLFVGVNPSGGLAAAGESTAQFNPFVKVGSDGAVTAIVKHYEAGQGISTGLSTLIAEEIGLRLDQIEFEFAPSNPELYANLRFGIFQGTGSSTSLVNSWDQYRQAGAAAREMLIAAAAAAWGNDASDITIDEGIISAAGHSAPIGDFVAAAAQLLEHLKTRA
ncbi:molybdopterin cofactor-binding domain-containing protein [Phaeobacter sp. BS52]|uniref:molybdopterin cofactor-binding domain-containing protein n=1 Tax=Phaeobacter sp. BS52 TaxID=2907241 RepID=UPI00386D5730